MAKAEQLTCWRCGRVLCEVDAFQGVLAIRCRRCHAPNTFDRTPARVRHIPWERGAAPPVDATAAVSYARG